MPRFTSYYLRYATRHAIYRRRRCLRLLMIYRDIFAWRRWLLPYAMMFYNVERCCDGLCLRVIYFTYWCRYVSMLIHTIIFATIRCHAAIICLRRLFRHRLRHYLTFIPSLPLSPMITPFIHHYRRRRYYYAAAYAIISRRPTSFSFIIFDAITSPDSLWRYLFSLRCLTLDHVYVAADIDITRHRYTPRRLLLSPPRWS